MQQQQSQTQASYIEEQTMSSEDLKHKHQKKAHKKKKKKSTKLKQQQLQDNFKTPKKRTRSQDQVSQQQQTTKSTKKKQPQSPSTPAPTPTPKTQRTKPNPPSRPHTPIFQKLLTSTILTIISIILFHQPPMKSLPPAIYEQGTHKPVFQIVTDRLTRYLKIQVQSKKELILGFESTKTADIRVGVQYTLGYQYEAKHDTDIMGVSSNVNVQMSDLKVLHYSLSNVTMIKSNNGYFNSWQFQDYDKLKDFVELNYIQQMEKKTLSAITDYKKKIYQQKAKYMLNNIVEKYQSWFDWILKRVDGLFDNSLSLYIEEYKTHNQQQKLKENEKQKQKQKSKTKQKSKKEKKENKQKQKKKQKRERQQEKQNEQDYFQYQFQEQN